MQTFVPYTNHSDTAAVLDDKRLFKQLVESKQLIVAITEGGGWSNHPAALMWTGYIPALIEYTCVLAAEWETRGWFNRGKPYEQSFTTWVADRPEIHEPIELPWWWGGPIHYTHKLKLTWKLPIHYESRFQMVAPNVEPHYYWPVRRQ